MKVLILGTGKTGTTVMVYKVAGGLPNCHAFSGGRPGKHIGDYENAVYKHTYEERKGKSFEIFKEHLNKEHYDRKIWMPVTPGMPPSAGCYIDGIRALRETKSNTRPILIWF
jgi:hypothetical protein